MARKLFLTTTAIGVLASALPALAQTSSDTTMTVSLVLTPACTISANSLTFRSVPATIRADPSNTTTIQVNCASEVSYKVALDAGQHLSGGFRRMSDGNGNFVRYVIHKDAAGAEEWGDSDQAKTYLDGSSRAGTGTGSAQTLTVHAAALTEGSVAGTFTDTVKVTVHY